MRRGENAQALEHSYRGLKILGQPFPQSQGKIRQAILRELLRQAELLAQEHRDAWLRAKAEADNIRKRCQIELANAYKYAIETLAAELLPVSRSVDRVAAGIARRTDEIRIALHLRRRSGAEEIHHVE